LIEILIVDDYEDNIFSLRALLESIDLGANIEINIHEATNGQDALNLALKESIDLVFLDIQMPNMNGFEVAKYLKMNKKTKDITIIFLTAVFKSEEFIKNGFDIGALEYLTKPIDKTIFIKKIGTYLKLISDQKYALKSREYFKELSRKSHTVQITLDETAAITDFNELAQKLFPFIENKINIYEFVRRIEGIAEEERKKLLQFLNNLNVFFGNSDDKLNIIYRDRFYELDFLILKQGYILVLKDITKEEELRRYNDELKLSHIKELELTKEKMLMVFTHELKTPLNGIIGFSSHLKRGIKRGITEKNQKKYLTLAQTVESLGHMMFGNITSMLDLNKINDGKLQLDYQLSNITNMVTELLTIYQNIYTGSTTTLDLDEVIINTDSSMMKHIIENLFTNGMKYGDQEVLVSLKEDGDDFIFSVEDDGPGIPPLMQQKIFELFEQGDDKELTRDKEGTGIGLYLVKKLCDDMKYSIEIKTSEKLNGAMFIVRGKIKGDQYGN
jgi:signal transduction histidine kinase